MLLAIPHVGVGKESFNMAGEAALLFGVTDLALGVGQQVTTVNGNQDILAKGVAGYLVKSVAGSSNVTLTAAEWQNKILEFTGALTGNIAVIVPTAKTRHFVVYNNTTGAFTLTVRTTAGSGVVASQGQRLALLNDATDVRSPNITGGPSGTIVGTTDTQTLTNKRINPRVVTLTDASPVTPNLDTTDEGILTTLSQDTTFANPTGTPVEGQRFVLRVKSTASRTLTYGTMYRGSTDLALPTQTSGSSKTDYWGFIYNAADTKLDLVGKVFGF